MSSPDLRAILDVFLARMDRGELPELDELSRAHPEHAEELRRMFADECARLEDACGSLSIPDAASARVAPARPIASEVLARLSVRGAGFERYSVRGEIGKGGMGEVLRVWDGDLRRELAMKVMRDAARSASTARFLEEAQVTSQLDHPGIVPVHEIGLDPAGRVYFTMKLVEGRTFAEVLDLARDGAEGWTQARALGVIQRVCEAMAYAHDKGVLHRDLKPANVMVGAFGEVYVMDWGLARVVGAEDDVDVDRRAGQPAATGRVGSDRAARRGADPSSSLLTKDGQVVGTPAYMPPEQARGRIDEVGPHSDVYAVGAMLHHLLAGRAPHAHAGDVERDDARTSPRDASRQPPALPASAPSELAAIAEKAMAQDWRARYRDMRELAVDVSAFLEGRVVRAHETGAFAEARKWVKRNRGVAASLAAVLLALVAGLAASLVLKASSDAHALRAQKIAGFLEEMLAGVRPSVALGRDTTMLREMLDTARKRIEAGELAAAPDAELRLLHLIGSTYREIAQYDLAEPLLRRAVTRARIELARDDALRPAIVSDLALLLDARGARDEAGPLAREALADRRRMFPGDHVDVASSLQNLATVMRSAGDLGDSERLLREAVAMHERIPPADSAALALALDNLAVVLEERGDVQGSESCARRALEIARVRFPAGHPTIAANANMLATLRAARGDFVGAEELHREALEMRRRLNPGNHPDVAASLNNLGFTLYQQREFEGAEQHFREALEMQRRLDHGDHAEVATSLDNLAATRVAQGDAAGGEALQLEALEMRRRLFPGGHADVALGLHNLAAALRNRGELERAEGFAHEAVEMGRRVLPADHDYLAAFVSNLGLVLEARGDLDGAERSFREALDVADRRAQGADEASDARRAQCERNLGRVLLHRERFADAEDVLVRRMPAEDEQGDVERVRLILELYGAWERAEPGRGHAEAAQDWQRRLDAAASPPKSKSG